MKKRMIALYLILFIVGGVLIVAAFTKKTYSLERSVTINKPDHVIFQYLKHLKNHRAFNAWLKKDPNMRESFKGVDGEIGFVYSYEGNKNIGAGEQELTGFEKDKKVDIELRFLKPMKSISHTSYTLDKPDENMTRVRCVMDGTMNYPLNFSLLFLNLDNFLGEDLELTVENLKNTLESNP